MTDIYENVTNRIVAALETGTAPWVKPWTGTGRNGFDVNHVTGRPYNGANVVVLWAQRDAMGYSAGRWLTFQQALKEGGCVRKGEKGTQIVFWNFRTKTAPINEDPEAKAGSSRQVVAKSYTVFNVEQCDGLQMPEPAPEKPLKERLQEAKAFCGHTGATITHGSDFAGYSPSRDLIMMPHMRAFTSQERYFATLLHELTHWTGHEKRCDRQLSKGRFGDQAYAVEELIAELGAAFACAELGVEGQLRHDSYIANWLTVLKNDKRAIFTAASAARKAHEYLKSLQPAAAATTEEAEAA